MANRFLTFKDYFFQIQECDLNQILGEKKEVDCNCLADKTKYILLEAENEGQEEICSYLRGRYKIDEIFAGTQQWSSGSTYFGKNLVVYDEPKFLTGSTYNKFDRVNFCGRIYECTTNNTTGATPSITATTPFNYIVDANEFFYANLPSPEFNVNENYRQGQLVWFEDNIYQAKQNIRGINPADSQNLELRYGIPSVQGGVGYFVSEFSNLPNSQPIVNSNWSLYNGPVSSWFTGTTYYFSGVQPTNLTYFTKGDNRNPQIKMYLIDIILYHLHSRLNPRNIPELRNIRYDGNSSLQTGGAIGWLKNVEKGKVNLNVPEIEPKQGGSIRFGSYPKTNNWY